MKKIIKLMVALIVMAIIAILGVLFINIDENKTTEPRKVGVIEIPGVLKEEVGQAVDNEYYLDNNIHGEEDLKGAVFLDYRNSVYVDNNKNTVLYGHNMKDGSKFGVVNKYLDDIDFLEENKYIIYEDIDGEKYVYEIFSVYSTDLDDVDYLEVDFKSLMNRGLFEFGDYVESIKNRSKYVTEVEVDSKSKVLTLSTCDKRVNKNGRTALHAVQVDDISIDDTEVIYNNDQYVGEIEPVKEQAGYATLVGDSYLATCLNGWYYKFDKVITEFTDSFDITTEDNFFNYQEDSSQYMKKIENKKIKQMKIENRYWTQAYERIENPKTGR